MKTPSAAALLAVALAGTFGLPLPAQVPAGQLPPISDTRDDGDAVPLREVDLIDEAPSRTIWGGAIFLTRNRPESQSLIREGGSVLCNANQFDFDTTAGPDLNALRHGENFDLDFRYFQVNNISAHRSIISGLGAELDVNDPVLLGDDILGQLYGTSVLSVETNLRRNITDRVSLLAGFRYIQLQEDLRTRFDLPLDVFPPIDFDVDGINNLYGAQTGVDAVLFDGGRFQILSAAKAGIYGNTARNAARLSIDGDGIYSFGTRGSAVSFVGDVSFTGAFQLNNVWSIRGGYQLLWLTGLALSSEQFPHVSHHFIPDAQVVTDGSLFLHGALVGLEAVW